MVITPGPPIIHIEAAKDLWIGGDADANTAVISAAMIYKQRKQ